MKKKQDVISATPLLGRNGLIAQTRSYVTRNRKKIMKQRKKKSQKVYRTNPDTISLNCDEFGPGWMMKPRNDSSFNPQLLLAYGLPSPRAMRDKVRQTVKTIKRKLRRVNHCDNLFLLPPKLT